MPTKVEVCAICGTEKVQRTDIPGYKTRTVCGRWPQCDVDNPRISQTARMTYMGMPPLPGFEVN